MRLTLDLDGPSELRLLMAYFNARRCGEVELERSPRGHGYHIVVRGIPGEAEHVLRCMLGDDPSRIRFDTEAKFKPTRILFNTKWMGGKRWDAEPMDERKLLALPFASKIPRGWYVCRRGR